MDSNQNWNASERQHGVKAELTFADLMKGSNEPGESRILKPTDHNAENGLLSSHHREAYDYVKAKEIAKDLETIPALIAADQVLKHMYGTEVSTVVMMVNYDLSTDDSNLRLDLKSKLYGSSDSIQRFDLQLKQDGKTIDEDDWLHAANYPDLKQTMSFEQKQPTRQDTRNGDSNLPESRLT